MKKFVYSLSCENHLNRTPLRWSMEILSVIAVHVQHSKMKLTHFDHFEKCNDEIYVLCEFEQELEEKQQQP